MSLTKTVLRIGTYNVRSARGEILELALKALAPMALDVCILSETNLQGFHTKKVQGFTVVATHTSSERTGGVALIYKSPMNAPWNMESTCTFGKNVVSGIITSGWRHWNLIGVYFPPSLDPAIIIGDLAKAAARSAAPVIICGDLNCRLTGERDKDILIASDLASMGACVDVSDHFCIKRHFYHKHTWRIPDLMMSAKCDYITSSDRRRWCGLENKQPRAYCSDHIMVVGSLIIRTVLHIHRKYVGVRRSFNPLPGKVNWITTWNGS